MFDGYPEETKTFIGTTPPNKDNNNSQLDNFWRVMSVLRRWWWLIGLIVVLIMSIVTVILFRITPIYKATTLLEVKQQERQVIEFSEVESVVVDQEFLTTQIQLLRSKSLINDTIESLNLLSDAYLVPLDKEEWLEKPRAERLRGLVDTFDRKLGIKAVGRSRLIEVSFEHSDPTKAARIANMLTANYLSNGLARKANSTAFAREFLEERLASVRASLETAERALVNYATQNDIIIVDGENTQNSSGSLDKTSLKILNETLTSASVARVEAEILYQQSLNSNFTSDTLGNNALSSLQDKRLALMSEYQKNLAIFKPAYPEMVELKSRIDLFDQEISQQKSEIISSSGDSFKNAYELALAKEKDLINRIKSLKENVVIGREKNIDYNILKRQVETERTQYEALLQRLKEVSVSDDLGANLVQVVDEATPSRNPFKPNRLRTLLLAFILSGTIGFGIAYAIEILDDRVKGPQDVKNKLKQIIMGVIPVSKNPDELMTELADSQSAVAEAYASLRTNLQFSGANGGPRIIQITSTRSGEGKSVSSLGTALRFAGIGQSVLLIDADMRRPTFLRGESKTIGLSGVLTQNSEFENEVIKTKYEGLSLLPSGMIVPNPSELLSSTRFDELLKWAAEKYDYVIVDSPPVLGLADAPILGAKVFATLLVVDAGALRTPNVKSSIERLQISGSKILGVILTKYKAQSKGYMNYYQYTYGGDSTKYAAEPSSPTKNNGQKRKFDLQL